MVDTSKTHYIGHTTGIVYAQSIGHTADIWYIYTHSIGHTAGNMYIYIYDLTEIWSCPKSDLVSLNDNEIPCLIHVDDIVLVATSQRGLQNQQNTLHEYCSKWYLYVITDKTKSLVGSHKTPNIDYKYGNEYIE